MRRLTTIFPIGGITRDTIRLTLLVVVLLPLMALPTAAAQDSEAVLDLKQKAQKAFLANKYEEALPYFLKIANEHPESQSRRYAVQMLATIYEENAVDVKKAIRWNREFLKKYADSRQAPLYKEKIDKLTALDQQTGQEETYKEYQKIRFSNRGDEYVTKKYETLVKDHPDFKLKNEVRREIAYGYDRLGKPHESFAAFQTISSQNGHKLSTTDQITAEANRRYWEMTTTWKWAAWGVVATLWIVALAARPWRRLDRRTVRAFLIWSGLWIALTASRMPTFYSLETTGYKFVITDTVICALAATNLPVLLWLILFTRGELWVSRPRALRCVSPVLTVMMTVAVIYLFIASQPNGPEIADVFVVKYQYLLGEIKERM